MLSEHLYDAYLNVYNGIRFNRNCVDIQKPNLIRVMARLSMISHSLTNTRIDNEFIGSYSYHIKLAEFDYKKAKKNIPYNETPIWSPSSSSSSENSVTPQYDDDIKARGNVLETVDEGDEDEGDVNEDNVNEDNVNEDNVNKNSTYKLI